MWEPPQAEVQRLEPQDFEVFSIGASFAEVDHAFRAGLDGKAPSFF